MIGKRTANKANGNSEDGPCSDSKAKRNGARVATSNVEDLTTSCTAMSIQFLSGRANGEFSAEFSQKMRGSIWGLKLPKLKMRIV